MAIRLTLMWDQGKVLVQWDQLTSSIYTKVNILYDGQLKISTLDGAHDAGEMITGIIQDGQNHNICVEAI